MIDEYFQYVRIDGPFELWRRLPRHADFKQEYFDGAVHLVPRPKVYHALLDLSATGAPAATEVHVQRERISVRPLGDEDWDRLVPAFCAAFERVQPFGSLEDDERRAAAADCLRRTRSGEDGPVVSQASFVAEGERPGSLVGAALVTLHRKVDLSSFESPLWRKKFPPADAVERHLGRPHLTWVFVGPWHSARGIGTALLANVAAALRALGYEALATTFLAGNWSSMLWHWRNGFRLLENPASWRAMERRFETSDGSSAGTTPPA